MLMIDTGTWVAIVLGAVVAGFVQGLSGFAFALVAMSVWAWTLPPQLAAPLTVFGALVGQGVAAVQRRGDRVNWRLLAPFLLGGVAGLPLGVLLVPYLDVLWFKASIGLLLAVWCPLMLWGRHLPRIALRPPLQRAADAAVGVTGGFMGGLGGFAGVVPTLWCTLCQMPREAQRTVVQNFALAMQAAAFVGYCLNSVVTVAMAPHLAVVGLAVLVPVLVGSRLYSGMSDARFRQLVLGLLTVSGIALLFASVPALLRR